MRKLLTSLAIEKLEGGDARREIADAGMPGLRLVVQPKPSGAKSWAVRYRYGGRARKLTLGPYPLIDLVKARQRAKDALEAIERGEDPAAEKKASRGLQHRPAADKDSFGELIRQFIYLHAIPNTRRWRGTAGLFGLLVDRAASKPNAPPVFKAIPDGLALRWADRQASTISRREIIGLLDEYRAADRAITANRVLAALSRFFVWCVDREIIDVSPAARIRKPTPEKKRERVLSDTELAFVWHAAKAEGYPFGTLTQLLILTAQRRDEVAGMSWPELDLVACQWSIPGSRTKNKRPHIVPLSGEAVDVIKTVPKFAGGNFLFGMGGRSAFSGYSHAKERLDQRIQKMAAEQGVKVLPWTLHDLRRTSATRMADLGVLPHIVEAVLNHISGAKANVAGVYNLSLYAPETRAALELWAKHVMAISAMPRERVK